jgi:hypothetical protein
VDHEVIAGERRLTFGQLVPLLLLILPILQVFEISLGKSTAPRTTAKTTRTDPQKDANKVSEDTEKPGAIYGLLVNDSLQARRASFPDLTTALRLNEPSKSEHKMLNDSASSHDPIVDHVMSSRAFRGVVWCFFAGVMAVSLAVIFANLGMKTDDSRAGVILGGGLPIFVLLVPTATLCVMPGSRRLK